mmetsp:Transcript_2188/g.5569  ORF Transcript_2188/g.5569 Transcript_2188/m.5569 type:complete len:214 (+) Transcript_2188:471-1112(+)
MYEHFSIARRLVVHHCSYIWNVKPSCSNISAYENCRFRRFKLLNLLETVLLPHLRMQTDHFYLATWGCTSSLVVAHPDLRQHLLCRRALHQQSKYGCQSHDSRHGVCEKDHTPALFDRSRLGGWKLWRTTHRSYSFSCSHGMPSVSMQQPHRKLALAVLVAITIDLTKIQAFWQSCPSRSFLDGRICLFLWLREVNYVDGTRLPELESLDQSI